MTKSATSSETTSDGPDRDAPYSLESTIQAAIDRASEAFEEVEGISLQEKGPTYRWRVYAAEMDNMGREWEDFYPLAAQLSQLRPTTLARLWADLIG